MQRLSKLYVGPIKVAFAILWLYLFVIASLQTIATNNGYTLPVAFFIGFFTFTLTYFIFYLLSGISIKINSDRIENNDKKIRIITLSILVITFLFYFGYFLCQYPGGSSSDVGSQYSQALIGEYSDWHPVLHTLLFFTIPLNLTNFGFPIVVFLQLVYFSIAFAYLMSVLIRTGIKTPFIILLCFFVWVNPYLATYFMYPWKDLAFTIFAIVLVGQYIQIVLSKGKWFEKKINMVAFAVISVLCMYMRHNAILFGIPLIFIAVMYARKNKKTMISIVILVVVLALSVQGLYVVLNVEKPAERTLETVGLPATIWCGVMQKNPEALPEETREVMYQIATQEQFNNNYSDDGSFNSIKWNVANADIIDAMSYGEVIKYTIQCFIYAPKASFESFAKLTDMVWRIDENEGLIGVWASAEQVGIDSSANGRLAHYYSQYKNFFSSSGILKAIFGSYGLQILILLSVGCVLFAKRRIGFIHALPMFFYNLGTMLLLSGSDYRFFVYNIPTWIAILFLMIADKSEFRLKSLC